MTTYARRLGLFSATMAVVGGIIGGGIFRTPAAVAERVGSPSPGPGCMGGWAASWPSSARSASASSATGGRAQAAGTSTCARPGARCRRSCTAGPCCWSSPPARSPPWRSPSPTTRSRSPGCPHALSAPVAVGAIVLLAGINYVGVAPGAITVNVLTVLKLVALATVIVRRPRAGAPRLRQPAADGGGARRATGSSHSARRSSPSCSPTAAGSRPTSSPRRSSSPSARCRARWCSA